MHNKNKISYVTLLILILLLLITLSLQSLVSYEIGQIGRNLVGKATGIDSGQVSICINNQPTINISSCTNNITAEEIYYCNVTAKDPDNNSLAFYDDTALFNINTLTGEISFTPTNANSGTYNLFITVQDNRSCSNSQNSDNFSLTISEVEEESEEESAPSGGGGGGGGTPYIAIPGFEIDHEYLKVLIKVYSTSERIIKISNNGDTSLEFSINIFELDEFIDLSDTEFSLVAGESKYVTIYVNSLSKVAGLYNGEILFKGGDLDIRLPVIIEVESLETVLDIKLEIPENFKILSPGEDISAKVSLFNLGDIRPIDILIEYFIKNMGGEVISQWNEEISLMDGRSFIQSPKLPENVDYGMYVFYAQVKYEDVVAVSGSIFEIKKDKRVEMPSTLENRLIAFQVWQAFKNTYGKSFTALLIIIILTLIGLSLSHQWTLKRLPWHHKRKMDKIHDELKEEAVKVSATSGEMIDVLQKEAIKEKRKIEEMHNTLQKEAIKERKKGINRRNLKRKLKIIEDAYLSKHISKKVYEKTKKDIYDSLNTL